jgi:hypothetical protein
METVEQVFERICKEKNWEKQELAEYIDVHPSTLSQKLGAHWNAHWRVFLKLLPILVQLNIINLEQLHETSDKVAQSAQHKIDKSRKLQHNSKLRRRRRYIMSTLGPISVISH